MLLKQREGKQPTAAGHRHRCRRERGEGLRRVCPRPGAWQNQTGCPAPPPPPACGSQLWKGREGGGRRTLPRSPGFRSPFCHERALGLRVRCFTPLGLVSVLPKGQELTSDQHFPNLGSAGTVSTCASVCARVRIEWSGPGAGLTCSASSWLDAPPPSLTPWRRACCPCWSCVATDSTSCLRGLGFL